MNALPEPGARWVARRKAAVVAAIEAGMLSAVDACARYGLSVEELAGWRARFARGAHLLMVKATRATVTISDDSDDRVAKRERSQNTQTQQSSLSSLIVTGAAPWAKRQSDESDEVTISTPA